VVISRCPGAISARVAELSSLGGAVAEDHTSLLDIVASGQLGAQL